MKQNSKQDNLLYLINEESKSISQSVLSHIISVLIEDQETLKKGVKFNTFYDSELRIKFKSIEDSKIRGNLCVELDGVHIYATSQGAIRHTLKPTLPVSSIMTSNLDSTQGCHRHKNIGKFSSLNPCTCDFTVTSKLSELGFHEKLLAISSYMEIKQQILGSKVSILTFNLPEKTQTKIRNNKDKVRLVKNQVSKIMAGVFDEFIYSIDYSSTTGFHIHLAGISNKSELEIINYLKKFSSEKRAVKISKYKTFVAGWIDYALKTHIRNKDTDVLKKHFPDDSNLFTSKGLISSTEKFYRGLREGIKSYQIMEAKDYETEVESEKIS